MNSEVEVQPLKQLRIETGKEQKEKRVVQFSLSCIQLEPIREI